MTQSDDEPSLNPVERQATEWLARLRAGARADQAAFEKWYSDDVAHADAYDRVLASWDLAGGLSATAPVRSKGRVGVYAAAAIAAALLLYVGAGWMTLRVQSASLRSFTVATRVGEVRTIALSDGSRLTLDTQSMVRVVFDSSRRHIRLLQGRAHFVVAAEARPFIIDTATASLATSGASLDIAYLDGQTRVGVASGEADLKPMAQNAALVRLPGGQGASVGQSGQSGAIARFTASDTRWTVGMLSYQNASLASVIAAANRYTQKRIELADPALGDLKFTGTFKATDTASLAHMLAAMFALKCDESDPARIVLSKPSR